MLILVDQIKISLKFQKVMAFTNLNYLQTITEGDTDSMRELINLFIDQVPEFIGNLKSIFQRNVMLNLEMRPIRPNPL